MDIGKLLRAKDGGTSVQKFTIYLPDRDKNDFKVPNMQTWIQAAINVMIEVNGGCTQLPVAAGAWRTKEGKVILENTVFIYSFIRDPESFEKRFSEIVEFMHSFGRVTDQDAVMAEFSGKVGKSYECLSYEIPYKNYLQDGESA